MRRALTALVLLASVISFTGCCTTQDASLKATKGNTRDLRILRSKMVPSLPDGDVEVGDKTWTLRGLWDNRIAAMIVRSRAIEAGLTKDKTFDTEQAAREEGVTKEPR